MRKKGYIKYLISKIVAASKKQLFWPTVIISVIGPILFILFLYLSDSTSSSGVKTPVPSSGIKGYVVGILFMIIFVAIIIVSINIIFRIVYYYIESLYKYERDRIVKLDQLVNDYYLEVDKLIVTKCFDEKYMINYREQNLTGQYYYDNVEQFDTINEIKSEHSNILDENILIININNNGRKDFRYDLLFEKSYAPDGSGKIINMKAKNCKIKRTPKLSILLKCIQWHLLVTIICYIILPLSHLLDNIIRENLDMTGQRFGGFTVLTFYVLFINALFALFAFVWNYIYYSYWIRSKLKNHNISSQDFLHHKEFRLDHVKNYIKIYRNENKLIALKYLDGSYYCNYKMYKTWEDLKTKYDIKDDEDYLIISVNKNAK